eukprot:NODE_3126_length_594_cov_503.965138_g2615_i0.p1 GENE.NODE_3126_length_594_cov_503.965138_g2615_i0~~NODE_3126_length_594_cov_503.965138_g2615_i0.p1  ORF type:complete len:149 (-),score=59.46 NODE_3126_length_594_cov_503.965138_g2615_i0:148-534(-)
MSWQTYVDTNMVGSGHVHKGALISAADGSVWAATPAFNITQAEADHLRSKIDSAGALCATGGTVGGEKFFTLQHVQPGLWYGKKGEEGICVAKSGQVLVVGVYTKGQTAANCNMTVEGVKDYLVSVSY